jgi:outer membrane protein assembly factor BamA
LIFVRYLILIITLFPASGLLPGQNMAVRWLTEEPLPLELPDSLPLLSSRDSCLVYLQQLHEAAYLEAAVDSIWQSGDEIRILLHLGKPYRWSYLDFSAIPPVIQNEMTLHIPPDKLFSYAEIQDLFQRILQIAENQGYPFAAVHLDSIGIRQERIDAKIIVVLNERIEIERIRIDGDLKLSNRYLRHLLDIEEGDLFIRDKIMGIRDRLEVVSFLEYRQDPVVEFLGNGATLRLFLDRKNANRFDILLGLLPSQNENRRFQLTGNVNIDLANQFGAGEVLQFNYENLMPGTQRLDLNLNYPFIFDWPFGADLHFNLYKRDSSYIDVGYRTGLQYFIRGSNYFQFFLENQSTNILTVDTNQVRSTRRLPKFLDVRQKLLGTTLHFEKLNYRINPRRGYDLTFSISGGTKKIKKNNSILGLTDPGDPEFDFNDLYQEIDLNSFQYKLSVQLQKYFPLFQSSTLKLASTTALIGSGQALSDNELYRIGGTRLLRGFNEESVFASFYSVFTSEYRLLFNRNSNLFIFWDVAYTEKNTNLEKFADRLSGVGTGLNLETKVGIFSISYALGTRRNLPLSFRQGRIHFGMTSQF